MKYFSIYLLLVFTLISCIFVAGSYPYAEHYHLMIKEDGLIEIIKKFKQKNPQYIVSDTIGLVDEKREHWYHVYFYYPIENQIVYTWIRSTFTEGETDFALVAIGGTNIYDNASKEINHDFGWFENRTEKKKFEERILNPIKEMIKIKCTPRSAGSPDFAEH